MSDAQIWQVRLPDGTVWIAEDSRPDDPRRSWIYSRSIADMFADKVGGTVVEVSKRQRESVLDKEIAFALNEPKVSAKKAPALKTRKRPFSREVQRKIATVILEEVPLNHSARSAIDIARETDDDVEHARALRTLKAGLPESLWIGSDPDVKHSLAMTSTVMPMWTDEDPEGGENPAHWMQIDRDEIARILVENP